MTKKTKPPKPPKRHEYLVAWKINLDATSHLDAAQQALDIMRDPDSLATVFEVTRLTDGDIWEVDLNPEHGRQAQ